MTDTIKIAVLALLRHEIEQLRDEPEEAELADECMFLRPQAGEPR